MQLFYLPNLDDTTFVFSEEESKHCVRVLRKKIGDQLLLIDGKGTEAIAIIDSDNPKKCSGTILSKKTHTPNRNYYLHLAIAPTKSFDRMEWMLEKAIEIGVDEISFIETSNSERAKINIARCEKIAIAALKQSKQFFLPKINDLVLFENFIKAQNAADSKWIAWCETTTTEHLSKQIPFPLPQKSVLLIGPEGDFSKSEIDLALKNNYKTSSLGHSILRAETAAVFGISLFAAKAHQ